MAVLDEELAQVQHRGEVVTSSAEDVQAKQVWNMLADGHGGLSWDGLPYACAHYGVQDIEGLMDRLIVIKNWRKPEERNPLAEG